MLGRDPERTPPETQSFNANIPQRSIEIREMEARFPRINCGQPLEGEYPSGRRIGELTN